MGPAGFICPVQDLYIQCGIYIQCRTYISGAGYAISSAGYAISSPGYV